MMELLGSMPGAVAQGLIWGIMAIGVYITYKVLGIADLTVDGSLCTGAAVLTVLTIRGVSPWLGILCAFGAGVAAGILTGFLHIFLGIPDILAGILCQMTLWSVNLKIIGCANLSLSARSYPVILTQLDTTKAIAVLGGFTVVLVGVLYWFFSTELGASLRSTGDNPVMSRTQGINTGFVKILGLAVSNGVVALAGALLCQYQGFADINMGRGAVVIGLAAVVIGTAVVKRLGNNFILKLFGVSLGAVIYYLVYQIIIFTGFDTDLLKMFSAIVVAVFLGIPYIKKKYHIGKRGAKDCA